MLRRQARGSTYGGGRRIAVIWLLLALVAAGCGSGGGGGSSQQDQLIIGMDHVTDNFDPISATTISDYTYWRFIYDTLVTVDSGKPEPWLAESWEAIDATHWRFKLRPGVKFSNGEPLDAEAVRFTFQRALDDQTTPWRVRIEAIERMEIIDPLTIDFHLSTPVGNWPTRTSVVWIVPPDYTQQQADVLVTKPIGTGPFTLAEFSPGQRVILSPNPEFWGTKPSLSRVELRSLPEQSTRVSALLAGDIDVAYRILPDFREQIESGGKKIISVPSGQSANIFFQTTRDTPLADVRVRQAIDYALDKKAIYESITQGTGRFLEGQIVGKNSVGYNPDVEARPYDPAKAKRLLAEAGYPNGFTVAFDYPVGRYYRDKEIGETISAALGEVGIKVQQNPMEGGAWLDRLYSGTWGPINYWSIQDAPAYDLSWTLEIFRSDNIRKIDADPKLDQMLDESFTITDTEARSEFLGELARYVHEQAYFVTFHQDPGLYAVDPSVQGIEFLPSTYINLFKATKSA